MPRRVTERIGFHYEGQYMEVEVRAGLPAAFYVDGVEIEPTLEMVKFATAAVRRNGGRNIERQH